MYEQSVLPSGMDTVAAERQRKLGKVYRLLSGLTRKRRASAGTCARWYQRAQMTVDEGWEAE